MNEIVVPIGDEPAARAAAEQAVAQYRQEPGLVHLVNVQRPLPRHVAQFFPGGELNGHYRDTGMQVLAPAVRVLDEAGVPHREHVLVGKPAEAIVQFAGGLCGTDRRLLDGEDRTRVELTNDAEN